MLPTLGAKTVRQDSGTIGLYSWKQQNSLLYCENETNTVPQPMLYVCMPNHPTIDTHMTMDWSTKSENILLSVVQHVSQCNSPSSHLYCSLSRTVGTRVYLQMTSKINVRDWHLYSNVAFYMQSLSMFNCTGVRLLIVIILYYNIMYACVAICACLWWELA